MLLTNYSESQSERYTDGRLRNRGAPLRLEKVREARVFCGEKYAGAGPGAAELGADRPGSERRARAERGSLILGCFARTRLLRACVAVLNSDSSQEHATKFNFKITAERGEKPSGQVR